MTLANYKIKEDSSIRDALYIIENNAHKIAIVVNSADKIIGSVTDGDIRRGLLIGKALENSIQSIMNPHPATALIGEDLTPYISGLKNNMYRQIIVVDIQGKLSDIISLKDLVKEASNPSVAVIMAGGKGQRLRPITESIPKPMVEVAGKPMLEHLIKQLSSQNFKKIFLTVNYKKNIIQDYFKDGADFGVQISYIEEPIPMGTAGSLSLLPKGITESFLVLNGDLITKIDFFALKHYHDNNDNIATVCVRDYQHQVPFGVIEIDPNQNIKNIVEKPLYTALVSTGIYAFHPKVLSYIPNDSYFDMPDLLNELKERNQHIGAFSVYESWQDVGKAEDLKLARETFVA